MYASIRRYEGAGKVDEITQMVKEGLLPIIKEVPGFVAYYAVDARHGVAITVSIFEDRGGAVKAHRKSEKWVKENLATNFQKAPEITSGEVVVYESAESKKNG